MTQQQMPPQFPEARNMGKPTIGSAVTPAMREEQRRALRELVVLSDESKNSIYYQVFLKQDEGDGA